MFDEERTHEDVVFLIDSNIMANKLSNDYDSSDTDSETENIDPFTMYAKFLDHNKFNTIRTSPPDRLAELSYVKLCGTRMDFCD